MNFNVDEQEDARTIYCGNLSPKITEEVLYELFLQAGPLEKVRIPIDRDGRLQSYGFITYKHQCSVPYAICLFENISLYNNRLNLRPRKMESYMPQNPNMFIQAGAQFNTNSNVNMAQSYNHTPSGPQDQSRYESLQARYQSPNKRDMRPNDNHRRNHKRRKR